MALDLREIRKTVIDSIKLAIGSDLSQTTNPVSLETYGMVLNARPNPEKAIPDYPYAVLDITNIEDTAWHITTKTYDETLDEWKYETSKTLQMQVSIYGGDAIQIGNKLSTAYRREDVRGILNSGNLALAEVASVKILPELLQTDFLEAAFISLTIRTYDVSVDPELESIEFVIMDGELECLDDCDPTLIHIDTTTP